MQNTRGLSGSAQAISRETATYLVSAEGARLLSSVASLSGDPATRILTLRKRGLDRDIAAGAVEIATARDRARSRFADAERLYFTSESLAQATSPMIARYHAARLAPFGTIADLGCGVGMDSIAFAEAGAAHVLALDHDPVRLIFARANAAVRCVADRIEFTESDVTALGWNADVVYWDPSRREQDGHRVSNHGDRYEPPLSFLEQIIAKIPQGGCVKLSPGLPDDVLAELGGTVEFLSEGRECKEACLWFGDLQRADAPANSAVLLPEEIVLAASDGDASEPGVGTAILEYVFDPDPAVVRAGALSALAETLELHLISSADSYLTGTNPASHRGASCYRVVHSMLYKARELSAWLRDQGIGRLVIKKRHFPREPDAMQRELRLKRDGRESTLILVRQDEGGHLAVICEPFTNNANF